MGAVGPESNHGEKARAGRGSVTNQLFTCSAGASDQWRTYLNQWKWRLANQMAAKMTYSTTNSVVVPGWVT
jgi:hypothetical protein